MSSKKSTETRMGDFDMDSWMEFFSGVGSGGGVNRDDTVTASRAPSSSSASFSDPQRLSTSASRHEGALTERSSMQEQKSTFPSLGYIPFPSGESVVEVGFDNSKTQSMFAERGNILRTEGLMNCIAVVAYTADGAVMRHYDTLNAYSRNRKDRVSGGDCFEFSMEAFLALRNDMVEQLGSKIGQRNASTCRFEISLGVVWANIDPSLATWQSRMNLLQAIIAVFGVEPTQVGSVASFHTGTNCLTASNS
jgi:hypothetical protein